MVADYLCDGVGLAHSSQLMMTPEAINKDPVRHRYFGVASIGVVETLQEAGARREAALRDRQ